MESGDQRARDPIDQFRRRVLARGLLSPEDLASIDARVSQQMDEAVEFGKASPYPTPDQVVTDVYVTYAAA